MGLRLPTTFTALKHRNYRLFFSGQVISLIGTWMQSMTQGWLVYKLTGSAFYLGLVAAAAQAPVLALTLVGGVIADRVAKRRLLMVTQSCLGLLALVLGTLTALEVVAVWHVALIAFLGGIAVAFDVPSRQAFVVEMVGDEDLMNAIALNSTVFHSARIIGPTIAGFLVASVGMAAAFLINSVSYLAVIAALGAMRLAPAPPREGRVGILGKLKEGLGYAVTSPVVGSLLLLVATFSVFALPYSVLLPVYARDILRVGPQGLGMLYAASGAGALVGALGLATFSRTRHRSRIILIGLFLFAVCVIFFGLSRTFALSLGLLFVSGISGLVFMASCNTLIQATVPDELRGRVMGMYSFMFLGLMPFGALLAGTIGEHLSATHAVLFGCSMTLVVVTVAAVRVPTLRQAQPVAPSPPPAPPGLDVDEAP